MICIIQREEQTMKIVDKRLRETADVINKKFAKVNEKKQKRGVGRNFISSEKFLRNVYV